ncbi:hypothetical protein [[Kitasatospora] papulosa]|uniref:Uncharacterized protein n=1 Tax=[Kitasatospora] papulosa TaxID=1464011 RepID=A0ABZ1KCQ1_9ACTN
MFGTGDLTSADRATKDSLHRAKQAAKRADAARTRRENASKTSR